MLSKLNKEIRKHYGDEVANQFGREVHSAFKDLEKKGIKENDQAMQDLLNEALARFAPKFEVEGIYPVAEVEWAYDDSKDYGDATDGSGLD